MFKRKSAPITIQNDPYVFVPQNYPSSLNEMPFNSESIENALLDSPMLKRNNQWDNIIEKRDDIPLFIKIFYDTLSIDKKFPNQDKYGADYKKHNKDFFDALPEQQKDGLRGRASRTYNSLVREIHFLKTIQENINNIEVIYNNDLDSNKGLDGVICYKGKYFGLELRQDSDKSKECYKDKKHYKFTNIQRKCFTVGENDCKPIWPSETKDKTNKKYAYWLFSETHLDAVIQWINN